jgi:hypothetical protein
MSKNNRISDLSDNSSIADPVFENHSLILLEILNLKEVMAKNKFTGIQLDSLDNIIKSYELLSKEFLSKFFHQL